jgi:hypothetical protein
MSILQSYPKGTPKSGDYIIGTSMPPANSDEMPTTRNFLVGSIAGLGNAPNVATTTFTVTDAQLRTLGTSPVTVLPAVTGYIYEILGIVTEADNNGPLGESYDWSTSGDGVFYGQGFTSTQHRLETPQLQFPDGSAFQSASVFVGTPIAGTFRKSAGIRLSTTTGVNPTITPGENPSANWIIYITYRLINPS